MRQKKKRGFGFLPSLKQKRKKGTARIIKSQCSKKMLFGYPLIKGGTLLIQRDIKASWHLPPIETATKLKNQRKNKIWKRGWNAFYYWCHKTGQLFLILCWRVATNLLKVSVIAVVFANFYCLFFAEQTTGSSYNSASISKDHFQQVVSLPNTIQLKAYEQAYLLRLKSSGNVASYTSKLLEFAKDRGISIDQVRAIDASLVPLTMDKQSISAAINPAEIRDAQWDEEFRDAQWDEEFRDAQLNRMAELRNLERQHILSYAQKLELQDLEKKLSMDNCETRIYQQYGPRSDDPKVTIFDKLSQNISFATEIQAMKVDKTLFSIPKANFKVGSTQSVINWLRAYAHILNDTIYQTSQLDLFFKQEFGIDLSLRGMLQYHLPSAKGWSSKVILTANPLKSQYQLGMSAERQHFLPGFDKLTTQFLVETNVVPAKNMNHLPIMVPNLRSCLKSSLANSRCFISLELLATKSRTKQGDLQTQIFPMFSFGYDLKKAAPEPPCKMNLRGGGSDTLVQYEPTFEPELPEKPAVFSESFEQWVDYEPIVRIEKANHQLAKTLLNKQHFNFSLFTLDQELEINSVLGKSLNDGEKLYVFYLSKIYQPQTLLEKMNVNLLKVNHIHAARSRTSQQLFSIGTLPLTHSELKAKIEAVPGLKDYLLRAINEYTYLKYSKYVAYQNIMNNQVNQALGTVILMNIVLYMPVQYQISLSNTAKFAGLCAATFISIFGTAVGVVASTVVSAGYVAFKAAGKQIGSKGVLKLPLPQNLSASDILPPD